MSQFTDEAKFEKVINFLPEKFVSEFVDGDLYNGFYHVRHRSELSKYGDYSKEALSKFSNPKIGRAFSNLNDALYKLDNFLILHFSIPDHHLTTLPEPLRRYYLEPKISHNYGPQPQMRKDSQMWDNYKRELDALAVQFKNVYKSFVDIGQKELQGVNSTQDIETLKSIQLLGDRFDPTNSIYLILDGNFDTPISFFAVNREKQPTAIKQLYNLTRSVNAPESIVSNKGDVIKNINNGLFRNKQVSEYMKLKNFTKPTLVNKSKDGKFVVLNKGKVSVTMIRLPDIPLKYQDDYKKLMR